MVSCCFAFLDPLMAGVLFHFLTNGLEMVACFLAEDAPLRSLTTLHKKDPREGADPFPTADKLISSPSSSMKV